MTPELEAVYIALIKAALFYMRPDEVCARYGVSKTFLRKKCGWRGGKREWV